MKENLEIAGIVTYHDSGETLVFTDPDGYLDEIRYAFDCRGINGWSYDTVSDDPELRLAVNTVVRGEFGLGYGTEPEETDGERQDNDYSHAMEM